MYEYCTLYSTRRILYHLACDVNSTNSVHVELLVSGSGAANGSSSAAGNLSAVYALYEGAMRATVENISAAAYNYCAYAGVQTFLNRTYSCEELAALIAVNEGVRAR